MNARSQRNNRHIRAAAAQMIEMLEARAYLSVSGVVLGSPMSTSASSDGISPVFANLTTPTIGDFNGDANQDLYISNQNDSVSVLLSNGDGSFAAPNTYAVSGSPLPLATGKFTTSGNVDIVAGTTNTGANGTGTAGDVSVLLGNGNGTFQPAINIPALTSNQAVAVGNFVNGGPLDVISASDTTSLSAPNLCLTITDGTGHLASQSFFTSPFAKVTSIAVGDFNGDGNQDFAISNQLNNSVTVYLGNGNGTFQAPQTYATGPAPTSIVASNYFVNGSSVYSLVTADSTGGEVSFLKGNGNGTFAAPVNSLVAGSRANGGGPIKVRLANFISTNQQDLVCLLSPGSSGDATVLLSNGDGTFHTGTVISTGGGTRDAIASGNIGGDALTDVVLTDSSQITALLNITSKDTSVPVGAVNTSQAAATAGATTYDFVVTYTDSYQVNAASLGNGNLTVTLPGGSTQAATLVSQNLGNAASVQATYQITFSSPLTTAQSGQTYQVAINANSVTNASGVAAAAGNIGSFNLVVNPTGSGTSFIPPSGGILLGALTGKILTSVVTGSKQKTPVSVNVVNNSGSLMTGTISVTLYQSTTVYNDNINGASAVAAEASVSKKVKNLKNGKGFVVHFGKQFVYGTAGTEYLVAEAALNGTVDSADSASSAITVAQAFVDANAVAAAPGKPQIIAGKNFPLTVTLQNLGNVLLKGTASVAVAVTPVGGGTSTTIAAGLPLHLNIQPSKVKKFPMHFVASTLPSTGTYTLTLTITLSGDANTANNVVTSVATVAI